MPPYAWAINAVCMFQDTISEASNILGSGVVAIAVLRPDVDQIRLVGANHAGGPPSSNASVW